MVQFDLWCTIHTWTLGTMEERGVFLVLVLGGAETLVAKLYQEVRWCLRICKLTISTRGGDGGGDTWCTIHMVPISLPNAANHLKT